MCVKEIMFRFDDHMYGKIDGVSMGSHLCAVLVRIFSGTLESKMESTLNKC